MKVIILKPIDIGSCVMPAGAIYHATPESEDEVAVRVDSYVFPVILKLGEDCNLCDEDETFHPQVATFTIRFDIHGLERLYSAMYLPDKSWPALKAGAYRFLKLMCIYAVLDEDATEHLVIRLAQFVSENNPK